MKHDFCRSTPLSRGISLFLVALLFFASYRPAVCLLSLAPLPHDGEDCLRSNTLKSRPRPTRQQLQTRVARFVRIRTVGVGPDGKRSPASLSGKGPSCLQRPALIGPMAKGLCQPDYLKPFLPDLPYNHLSPPA